MKVCNYLVNNGIKIRMIVTIILFYVLSKNQNNKVINKYIYLILPLFLTILDGFDSKYLDYTYRYCTKLFYYQCKDKIFDLISYLLLFIFFKKLDYILLLIILYRAIGVFLFYITKDSKWLILFFDFVKEYLVYMYIFGNNYKYIGLFILCKVLYEYHHHNIRNPNNYTQKNT